MLKFTLGNVALSGGSIMKKVALSAIALSAFISGSALAADLGVPAYKARPLPPPPVYSWTGCFVGAGGGYGMWNQDRFLFDQEFPSEHTALETGGGRGWFGTVQVGCDYQFAGDWV